MNKKDKERLHELKIRVWAIVCKNLILGKDKAYQLTGEEIESNRGRLNKALRLLMSEGIIDTFSLLKGASYEKTTFHINHLEKAREHGIPLDTENISYYPQRELLDVLSSGEDAAHEHYMYISIYNITNEEAIYIYFNRDIYDFVDYRGLHIYPKEKQTERKTELLKMFVELELNYNYPYYLNHVCGIGHKEYDDKQEWEFKYKKYLFMDMMSVDRLTEVLNQYQKNLNFINQQLQDIDHTVSVIESQYGDRYDTTIEKIRRIIIENMLNNKDILPIRESKYFKWSSKLAQVYKDLCNYENIYEKSKDIYIFDKNLYSYWIENKFRSFNKKEDLGYETEEDRKTAA